MSDLDLYKDTIIEEAAHPANRGALAIFDATYRFGNASCGDMFTIYIQLSPDRQTVQHIGWEGEGCAISTAAMSIVSQEFIGKSVVQIQEATYESVIQLLGLSTIAPGRIACASVGLIAVQKALALVASSGDTV